MIQVSIAISVGENASDGSMINVANIETIPGDHDDIPGMFLAVEQSIRRLAEDVTERATDQARQWSRMGHTPA